MTAYLQTWSAGVNAAREREGESIEIAGSNQYPRVGLAPGDVIYIVYLDEKRMHLIGRLPVAEIIDRQEAVQRRGPAIWRATSYAVARRDTTERFVFDLRVPEEVVRGSLAGGIDSLEGAARS